MWAPGGYGLDPHHVILKKDYDQTQGRVTWIYTTTTLLSWLSLRLRECGGCFFAGLVCASEPGRLGNIERKRIRCVAIARCMSLHLAVTYADVINSVVLQDDFLPRTTTALEDVFKSIIWLYHIVVKPLRLGRYPPVVRTAVPVDGRFDQLVLSCNAT
ncbi:hypothetical protein Bca52824_061634 [Brassica carinata]|uniref:Uncharacterized protein n=1 Tax=Brassica carinata TaxID=52824 RepID=A0A8X7QY53_BRACI|nr:hypothetical protein Bca52824_061634 [Brassica carinata]